ncbi:MAG: hypothetical protein HY791_14340 [Deltaproteobacteria bacterium]|nr:hypothetical protein [Deltaproteobacteria bacterium]
MSMPKQVGVSLLLITALVARTGWADEHGKEHAHKAPHGGIVQTVGKYHVELVSKDAELNVYLLDANEKTLPIEGREAKVVLQVPKREKQNLVLTPAGEFLRAAADLKDADAFVAVVSINLDGALQSARFAWKRAGGHGEHGGHEGGHEEHKH